MRTIWKFQLGDVDNAFRTDVEMPVDAKILSVAVQNDLIQVWAMVDSEAPKRRRRFSIRGTGHQCHDGDGEYVGTAMFHGGRYVFHVFDGGYV